MQNEISTNPKIGIIGYGSLGIQVHEFLKEKYQNSNLSIIVFDDIIFQNTTKEDEIKHLNISEVLPFNDYKKGDFAILDFYIGLGYKHLDKRKEIVEELINLQRNVPKFIHHTAYINPTAEIGFGTYIYPKSNIDQKVKIGKACIINNSVTVSHESTIGDACFLAPMSCLCGCVEIANCVFIGANTTIANNINIGNHVKIGIGSVITKNIISDKMVIGYPAKNITNLNLI